MYALDPRVKILQAILVNLSALFLSNQILFFFLYAFVFILLLSVRMIKPVFGFFIFFISYHIIFHLPGGANNPIMIIFFTILFLFIRFGPMMMIMMFMTKVVNVTNFIISLEKMKIPREIVIPMGVTLRFIPSMFQEFGYIRDAMKLRNINFSILAFIKHPIRTIEYFLVPLLMRSLKIGDELAASAVTRAIESPFKKTFLHDVRLKAKDFIYIAFLAVGFSAFFILDKIIL